MWQEHFTVMERLAGKGTALSADQPVARVEYDLAVGMRYLTFKLLGVRDATDGYEDVEGMLHVVADLSDMCDLFGLPDMALILQDGRMLRFVVTSQGRQSCFCEILGLGWVPTTSNVRVAAS